MRPRVLALASIVVAFAGGLVRSGHGPGDVMLRWRAPEACVAWTLTTEERFEDPRFGPQFNRAPERSSATLWWTAEGMGLDGRVGVRQADDPGEHGDDVRVFRHGAAGVPAPDLACRDRSWDPIADALALGWPVLPTAPISTGSRWLGAPVRGDGSTCSARRACCALAVCDHACVLPPWEETLVRVEGDAATLRSRWRGGEAGSATRTVELDLARGLPRRAHMELRLPASGVVRTLAMRPTPCPPFAAGGTAGNAPA